jgi:RNA polymerase sigma-70 factor, ECF subfamily
MLTVANTLALPMAEASFESSTFERCYEEHREAVYRWALRYAGGQRSLAEDLAHDVFVRLWEKLPRLKDQDDLAPWLFRVTANLAISRIRKDGALTRIKQVFQLAGDERDEAGTPDEKLERAEDSKAALKMLRQLPAKERVVLCLKLIDGKSQRQISEQLSMSEGYVSKLVTRGLDKVRAAGWEVSDAA